MLCIETECQCHIGHLKRPLQLLCYSGTAALTLSQQLGDMTLYNKALPNVNYGYLAYPCHVCKTRSLK